MYLCGVYDTERIVVHPEDAPHTSHYIDITKDKNDPAFYVTQCCDEEWVWKFWYSKTNYEVVKFLIMDCIAECETMEEFIDALDEVFEEDCADIVYEEAELQEDEFECDGDCANCGFYED